MTNVQEVLSRKVGPLPVGLWILGVGGGLAVAWYLRSHPSSVDPTTGDALDPALEGGLTTGGTGGAAFSDPSVDGLDDGDLISDTATGGTATSGQIGSQAEWRRKAVLAAIGFGYTAITAENAVGRYLTGKSLHQTGASLINKVEAQIGPPPQAVPPIVVIEPKASSPVSQQTNGVWKHNAREQLKKMGYKSHFITTAFAHYFAGGPMSGKDRSIIAHATAAIGPPPHPPAAVTHAATVAANSDSAAVSPTSTRDTGT